MLQSRILGRFSQLDHTADGIRSIDCRAESFHDFRGGLPTEELLSIELIDPTDLVPLCLAFRGQCLQSRFGSFYSLLYLSCLYLGNFCLLTIGHFIG